MTVKITSLEAENIKRIKAVQLEPSQNGLTVIGGRNGQGKTSVLDAIAWALGGNKMKPSEAHRDGSVQDPEIKIRLNNGLIVERKGKNSELKVTDPSGQKSGQRILDAMIGEMALNVPKFMACNSKEKANYLLQIVGVGDQLKELDREEENLSSQRLYSGQQYRAKKAHADQMQSFDGFGTKEISAIDLIQKQQAILLKNAENAKKRQNLERYESELPRMKQAVQDAETALQAAKENLARLLQNIEIARKDAVDLYDERTDELERSLAQIEEQNARIRMNAQKQAAMKEAESLKIEYQELTHQIDLVRQKRMDLLKNAPLPLPDLTVKDGEIIYKGHQWDGMSGSEQLKVSAAICRAMNPNCGFVLLDKLEQMDSETMNEFGQWLESEGLQAIATRVSTGDECSIIIEDGKVKGGISDDSKGSDQNSNLGSAWSW